MKLFIGADHGGFQMKNELIDYLKAKNLEVEDMGAYQLDPLDDFPDSAQKVSEAVLQDPHQNMGIVICRSGQGACMAANRFRGIRCALAFSEKQASHGRQDDHANVLALGADYIDLETAKKIVDAFLLAQPKTEGKYLRRVAKLETI